MIKIFQFQNETQLKYENLVYEPISNDIMPKWGCTSQSISERKFRIIGGVFGNEEDFKMISSGVYIVEIKESGKYKSFSIEAMPKSTSKGEVVPCIKPKINYVIKVDERYE